MTAASKKRRIAFVSDAIAPFNKGGKETRLREISQRLAANGHDVHIYTMNWWDGARTIQKDGITLHAISRLHPLYQGNRRSMSEAVFFGLATFKLLFAKFDVLDVDSMPFFPLFSARLVCWLRGKKLNADWHEVTDLTVWKNYVGPAAGLVAWTIERLAMLTPDTIISNSPHTTRRLIAAGSRKTIVTVPLGVNLPAIYDAPASTQKTDVIFVGRLLAHKNAAMLVEAIAAVKASRPDIICLIIGAGPEKPALERLIAQLGLKDNVTLSDFIDSHTKVFGLMKSSKIFALPSVREGFGLAAIEANAAGLPVITTGHPDNATRELISENVNGIVIEPTSDALATGILRILESKHKFKPQTDLDQYDWKVVTGTIEKVFTA